MVIDPQPLTALGIRAVVDGLKDVELLASVDSREAFTQQLVTYRPVLVIVDYMESDFMSSGDLREIQSLSPDTKILVISADEDRRRILDVLQMEISGYLTKGCRLDEISTALENILRGEKYFAQKILALMLDQSVHPEKRKGSSLTEREKQLLTLLAKGYSTLKAADELHVSPHTIHSHRKKIIRKLGIQSPTQYVVHAIEMGLIKI